MDNINKNINEQLRNKLGDLFLNIEKKPFMYFAKLDFHVLQSFIQGYVCALDHTYNTTINLSFSKWITLKQKKSSLFWNDYIYIILAKEDPVKAYNITLQKWIEFSQLDE